MLSDDLKRKIRESLVYAVFTASISSEWRYVIVGEFFHSLNRKAVLDNQETQTEIDYAYNQLRSEEP